MKKTLLALL